MLDFPVYSEEIPTQINYQGYVASGGTAFTGTGRFKFAFVNSAGDSTYWSNDGTSTGGSEPTNYVSVSVSNGVFNVILGDATLTNMQVIPVSVFRDYNTVYLKVWFSDILHSFELLSPNKKITSSAYAYKSAVLNSSSQNAVTLNPYHTDSGDTGEIRFLELLANGTNYIGFKSPDSLDNNYILTLPVNDGNNGQFLQTNGSGVLAWADASSGGITQVGSMTTSPAFGDSTASGDWLGLGSSAGRISFTDAATDHINVLNGNLVINDGESTIGNAPLHVDAGTSAHAIWAEGGTDNCIIANSTGSVDSIKGYAGSSGIGVIGESITGYGVKGTSAGSSSAGGYFTNSGTGYSLLTGAGNVGIGDATPVSLFTVGSGDKFQVDSNGNIVSIDGVGSYDWPNAHASGVLTNNGSGTLSWASASGANTALSNLASVAVNTSLVPSVDGEPDLGSTSKDWNNIYLDGLILMNNSPYIHNTGSSNFFAGVNSGNISVTGGSNTGVGQLALGSLTEGQGNTAVGNYALFNNTTGYDNVAVGYDTLFTNISGAYNIAVGNSALLYSTAGYNIAVGWQALMNNVSGTSNVAIGWRALYGELYGTNNTGGNNIAIGQSALQNNTSGGTNIGIGQLSLGSNLEGGSNIGIGFLALYNCLSSGNVAIGSQTGYENVNGIGNVFLGYNAGYNETGSNKLYIDNSNTTTPLVYGDFDSNAFRINGMFQLADGDFSNYIVLQGPATVGTNYTLTLPSAVAVSNDMALVSDTSGALSWKTISGAGGLGTMSTQNSNSVSISGGSISGITDLAVADGGTGASDATNARLNLGLGTISTQAANSVSISGGTISGITDLAVADGGTGASDDTNARLNLGLGTISTQAANSVSISGGTISGITDLAVADGGTGASNASGAKTNLGFITDLVDDTTPQLGGDLDCGANTVVFTQQTIASGTSMTVDWGAGNKAYVYLGVTGATMNMTNPSKSCNLTLMIKQNGGSRTITTWTPSSGSVKWAGGAAPTLSTANGAIDIISFYFDGTDYYGTASLNFQ
jgi:hypothetical protein